MRPCWRGRARGESPSMFISWMILRMPRLLSLNLPKYSSAGAGAYVNARALTVYACQSWSSNAPVAAPEEAEAASACALAEQMSIATAAAIPVLRMSTAYRRRRALPAGYEWGFPVACGTGAATAAPPAALPCDVAVVAPAALPCDVAVVAPAALPCDVAVVAPAALPCDAVVPEATEAVAAVPAIVGSNIAATSVRAFTEYGDFA